MRRLPTGSGHRIFRLLVAGGIACALSWFFPASLPGMAVATAQDYDGGDMLEQLRHLQQQRRASNQGSDREMRRGSEQSSPQRPGGGSSSSSAEDREREARRERARQEAERRRAERLQQAATGRQQPPQGAQKRSVEPSRPPSGKSSGDVTATVGPNRRQNRDLSTFSFSPVDVHCRVGDQFGLALNLEHPSGTPFDALSVTIQYNPEYLEPAGSTTEAVEDTSSVQGAIRLDKDPQSGYLNYIDHEKGIIRFAGVLPNNNVLSAGGHIFSVTFEALKETLLGNQQTVLEFLYERPVAADAQHNPSYRPALESGTYLARLSEDLLGDREDPEDGGIMTSVQITGGGRGMNKDDEYFIFHHHARSGAGEGEEADPGNSAMLHIRAIPPEDGDGVIRVGDEFDVEIVFSNPEQVEFNRVSLFLAYNRRVLKPLDYDRVEGPDGDTLGNWIQHGINILDGPYHEEFPFNLFSENRVRTDRGLIVYEAGNQKDVLTSQGTLARCRFRAIAPTTSTRLKAFFNRFAETPTTGIFLHNVDVLGKSLDHTDGVSVEPFAILPALPDTPVAMVE